MQLLKKLCEIRATSGDELPVKNFILEYVLKNQKSWKTIPELHHGAGFQDCLILSFGKPRTALFAHMDSIGFTVRYDNELVRIGGPQTYNGIRLVGRDSKGEIDETLEVTDVGDLKINTQREIDPGTTLTFLPDFRETNEHVQCCYLDNRLGIYAALKVAETLENGLIIFSAWEEHGGGSIGYLSEFMIKNYSIYQTLICDITWVTEGVSPGKGVVISLRDSGIPRRSFINSIIDLARKSKIPFQLEVEGSGGSDGIELQRGKFPIDWCFIGAPEEHVHSPDEKVNKDDIESMIQMYSYLMGNM
jgi:putative aminopeptidase FrvX